MFAIRNRFANPKIKTLSLQFADLRKWPALQIMFVHMPTDCPLSLLGVASSYIIPPTTTLIWCTTRTVFIPLNKKIKNTHLHFNTAEAFKLVSTLSD